MSILNNIKSFNKQFSFVPKIENESRISDIKNKKILIVGMGGSNLVADLLQSFGINKDIRAHKSYDLPKDVINNLHDYQIIISSYSGNTEESLSAFAQALSIGLVPFVVTSGGKLLNKAEENNVPYIAIPDDVSQPRVALGYSLISTLSLLGERGIVNDLNNLSKNIDPKDTEEEGESLSKILKEKVPVIYSSQNNKGLAYIWKIKLNETGKHPAFYNVLPEMNHNEIEGYQLNSSLTNDFHFIFLRDENDDQRIIKHMDATVMILKEKNLSVSIIEMNRGDLARNIVESLILVDWTSYHLAKEKGVDPEAIPTIDKLKEVLKR